MGLLVSRYCQGTSSDLTTKSEALSIPGSTNGRHTIGTSFFIRKILLLPCLLGFASHSLCAETIKVGYFNYPPLVTGAQGSPTGLLIDYVNPIYRDAGVRPRWQEVSLQRGLQGLRSRQLDVLLMLIKNKDRERLVKFSGTRLFEARPALCGKAGQLMPGTGKRLRLAHSLATYLPESLRQHDLVSVSPQSITERMLTMLEKGRIDGFFYVNPEALAIHSGRMPGSLRLHCYVFPDSTMQVHMVYANSIAPRLETLLNISLAWHGQRLDFDSYLRSQLQELDSGTITITTIESKAFAPAESPESRG